MVAITTLQTSSLDLKCKSNNYIHKSHHSEPEYELILSERSALIMRFLSGFSAVLFSKKLLGHEFDRNDPCGCEDASVVTGDDALKLLDAKDGL